MSPVVDPGLPSTIALSSASIAASAYWAGSSEFFDGKIVAHDSDAWKIATEMLYNLLGRRTVWPPVAMIDILPLAPSIFLTGRPVIEIFSVQDENGNDLPYTVENTFILRLNDYDRVSGRLSPSVFYSYYGEDYWGCCPDIPVCSDGMVYITYTYGAAPTPILEQALATLAIEVQKAIDGDATCRLPRNATSVARQGVTVSITDAKSFMDGGLTGIPEVDLAIVTYNPSQAKARSRVFSPSNPPTRRINPAAGG